ncbi:hypothetical protein IHE45_18G025600 [Dioscorea alata]|uniref:Uncharacterized protein n=1 Tax=Dioscorea alata TaxID=55571 RepID=A0ACB7U5V3_DIOAL|nr:hypothetical protein IHE45_18G025600 [Dioscorea alata]
MYRSPVSLGTEILQSFSQLQASFLDDTRNEPLHLHIQ